MTEIKDAIKGFVNDDCGGYHTFLYDDETGEEDYIGDHVEKALNDAGLTNFVTTETHAFDSPGMSVSILSVAYEDKEGNLRLGTIELIDC